jgi:AAA family ATP:ADP antiporter
MSTLRGLIDIRQEERRNTFAAFATLLAITTGHTLLETARDALFLSKLPAAHLPWMYLVSVGLALTLARVRRADSKGVIAGVLLAGGVVTSGFWLLLTEVGARGWVLYGLYAWCGLFAAWVTVQFWTLLGRVHTMTQAKRLYGFIGAGAVLGGVVGAFLARAALAFVPPRAMLLTSAALFVVTVLPVLAVRLPEAPADARVETRDGPAPRMMTGVSLLYDNAFARRVLGIVLAATVAVTLADFLFKARLAAAYTDSHVLAARLSSFYAVVNTVALVAQILVGPWIFRTLGVQRALFLFPMLLLGASSGVLATGGALISAVILKGLDGTLRYSVHRTSMELLLVPIPDGTRERIKPIIELVGTRGGQALASVTILVLVAIGASNTLVIGAFVFAVAVLWFANVVTIRGHYLDVFRDTLRAGGLSGKAELPELDLGALEMLFAGLNSSRDVEVLASLELLADQHRERLIPALILYHPSREVVLRALHIFTQHGRTDFVPIADRLDGHPDREVAAAALRARTTVAPDRKLLEKRLAEADAEVAATALIALIARNWIAPEEAERRIREAIETRSWQTAAELARAIRDIAGGGEATKVAEECFDELLIRLARESAMFRDVSADSDGPAPRPAAFGMVEMAPDVRVRLEVARAMATRKSPAFLPVLVGMLNRHELRAAARAAIALIPGALEFLDEVMGHDDYARDVRVHVPRTLVLFDPVLAVPKLLAHLVAEKDGAVRFKVLRALVKLRRENPNLVLDVELLQGVAENNLDHSEELRLWGVALAGAPDDAPPASLVSADPLRAGHHLLVDFIRDKERHARQRLFMVLELLYGEDFEDIERGLRSKQPNAFASSLELVENIVRPPLRSRVVALVGELQLDAVPPTYEEAVAQILVRGGNTMRTLAEHRAMELGMDLGSIDGRRPSQPPAIESLGRRREEARPTIQAAVDRVRDLLTPESSPLDATGAFSGDKRVSRAPA